LNISPIWISLVTNMVRKSQGMSVWSDRFFVVFSKVLVLSVQFLLHRWHQR
jgi:hypothetical protein